MSFVQVTGLCKSYRVGETPLPVLRGLDLFVEAGQMVAIVGASGVGLASDDASEWGCQDRRKCL